MVVDSLDSSSNTANLSYIVMDCGGSKLLCTIHLADSSPMTRVYAGVGHGSGELTNSLITSIVDALSSESELRTAQIDVIGISFAAIPVKPTDREAIARAIFGTINVKRVVFTSDTVTAYLATSEGDDLVITVGTGITALFEAAGELREVSGHGYLYGDEGSGYWIGKEGINRALQSADMRGPQTALLPTALEHFETDAANLANVIHQLDRPVPAISAFAQRVLELAESGDHVAQKIVDDAVHEVFKMAEAASKQADISSIKFIGGLIGNSDYYFNLIRRKFEVITPSISVGRPSVAPIDGVRTLIELSSEELPTKDTYEYFSQGLDSVGSQVNYSEKYLDALSQIFDEAKRANTDSLHIAVNFAAASLKSGGLIHTFGTGHSHLLAEEIFYRAGGLAPVYPILDERLMLHKDVIAGSQNERLPGLAEELIGTHPIKSGDSVIIISNSGGNQVSIDLAIKARELGAKVIVLTSIKTATSARARAKVGKKLHEYADVVLDNCGVPGDALISIPGVEFSVGPTSTAVGAALLQALVVGVVAQLHDDGIKAEVFLSSNMEGGDTNNQALFAKYFELIPLYR